MANEAQNGRRKSLLAVLLALIGASLLCLIAVAAAGYTISSPLWDSVVAAFGGQRAAAGGADGGGGEQAAGGGAGGGGQAIGSTCAFGILCLNASGSLTATSGREANAGSTSSISTNTKCFLGLICFTSKTSASTSGILQSRTSLDTNLDGNGATLDTSSSGGTQDRKCLFNLCINVEDMSLTEAVARIEVILHDWWNDFLHFIRTSVKIEADTN